MRGEPDSDKVESWHVKDLAEYILRRLSDKSHDKHPHIGLIDPAPPAAFDLQIGDLFDAANRQGPFRWGYEIELQPLENAEEKEVKSTFEAYFRVAPPGAVPPQKEFRRLKVVISVREAAAVLKVSITDGESVHEREFRYDLRERREISREIPERGSEQEELFSNVPGDYIVSARTSDKKWEKDVASNLRLTMRIKVGMRIEGSGRSTIYRFMVENGQLTLHRRGRMVTDGRGGRRSRKTGDGRAAVVFSNQAFLLGKGPDGQERTWSFGKLLEPHGELELKGYRVAARYIGADSVDDLPPGLVGLRTVNCQPQIRSPDELSGATALRFADASLVEERTARPKRSDRRADEFIENLILNHYPDIASKGLSEPVCRAVKAVVMAGGGENLYEYQEEAMLEIVRRFCGQSSGPVLITAGTAGGKTLAFMLPAILQILHDRIRNGTSPGPGVRVISMYPTRALANDQCEQVLRLATEINRELTARGSAPISVGILHGDTPDIRRLSEEGSRKSRIRCPGCRERLVIEPDNRAPETGVAVRCENTACEFGSDPQLRNLLNGMLRVVRDQIFRDPPDILITTPDMLNYVILSGEPEHHTIIGRRIFVCPCGSIYTLPPASCGNCGAGRERFAIIRPSVPFMIILDEVHWLRGAFGGQVAYFLRMLREAVRISADLPGEYDPLIVMSSATIPDPPNLVQGLLLLERDQKYSLVRPRAYEFGHRAASRYHLSIVPKGYTPQATLLRVVQFCFERWLELFSKRVVKRMYPSVLVFTDTLAESNELTLLLRSQLPDHVGEYAEKLGLKLERRVRVDGHTSDYETNAREEAEDRFSRGESDVLVATPTLEVGIDFERVDILILYGFPRNLSNYIQRIGRAGRRGSALVVNIFLDRPLDMFYWRNLLLLTDPRLREAALAYEYLPVAINNDEVIKRSMLRSIVMFVTTHPSSPAFFSDTISWNSREGSRRFRSLLEILLDGQCLEHLFPQSGGPQAGLSIPDVIAASPALRDLLQRVMRTIDDSLLQDQLRLLLVHLSVSRRLREALDSLAERLMLRDLRAKDVQVTVEFPGVFLGSEESARSRELSYAIRHYYPGMIASYQGRFFFVREISVT